MAPEESGGRDLLLFAGVAVGLAAIAAVASPSYVTDRDMYEQIGRAGVLPDCSSLHCTRVLVAWVIEHLPGPSLLKWKAYAVLGNLLGAAGVAQLCRRFGVPAASRRVAIAVSAFSAGSQITLSDPHSSDPFIYALAPWMVSALFDGRFVLAGIAGAVGVFAKEFAAAPLWIFAAYAVLARDRARALRSLWAAAAASAVWLTALLWVVLRFNYSFGGNPSSRVFEGGYIVTWVSELGVLRAAGALALHLGPLVGLVVASFPRAPRALRLLTLASLPAMLVLSYVQQPDRAMWNFQFALIPMAAALFNMSSPWLNATFLTGYAISNLPFDGRPVRAVTGAAFAVCVAALAAIVVKAWAARASGPDDEDRAASSSVGRPGRDERGILVGAGATLGGLVVLLVVAADVAAHRRVELGSGMNIWGYRGPVVTHRKPGDARVAVLGGREVFGTQYQTALPRSLQEFLNNDRLRGDAGYPRSGTVTVVNLAGPFDPVLSFRQTFRDYAALDFDLVCFYVGDENAPPPAAARVAGWRRQSAIFRATGYLPLLPSVWLRMPDWSNAQAAPRDDPAMPPSWEEYSAALDGAITDALERGAAVLVATHPFVTADEAARQDALAAHLKDRFGGRARFAHVDLRFIVDRRQPHTVEDLSQAAFRQLKAP